jgi:hypothetical protein
VCQPLQSTPRGEARRRRGVRQEEADHGCARGRALLEPRREILRRRALERARAPAQNGSGLPSARPAIADVGFGVASVTSSSRDASAQIVAGNKRSSSASFRSSGLGGRGAAAGALAAVPWSRGRSRAGTREPRRPRRRARRRAGVVPRAPQQSAERSVRAAVTGGSPPLRTSSLSPGIARLGSAGRLPTGSLVKPRPARRAVRRLLEGFSSCGGRL